MRARTLMHRFLPVVLGVAGCASPLPAEDAGAHAFVGAEKCKMCHNSPVKGEPWKKWSESAHARAWETLASEESRKIAAAKGIADARKAPECLRCHVTGQDAPPDRKIEKYRVEDGVWCESCHGPGGDYWKIEIMKDPARAKAAGLVKPDESACRRCHNPESPKYKEFDYKTFAAQIAHPNPQKTGEKK